MSIKNEITRISEAKTALADEISKLGVEVPSNAKIDEYPSILAGAISNILNLMYPVGAIYISVNNVNPTTLFGGTWEQIKDTFLLASGTSYTLGSTGGEATHILTTSEMPRHSHDMNMRYQTGSDGNVAYVPNAKGGSGSAKLYFGASNEVGSSNAHNNMPPYLAVNVWKRIS